MKTIITLAMLVVSVRVFAVEAVAAPTFSRDIAPIIWANCSGCHHAGEVAPFTLTSYDDVKKRAKQIVKVTPSRLMPPWKAAPGAGDFAAERRLPDAQIAVGEPSVAAGAPEGTPAALPPL